LAELQYIGDLKKITQPVHAHQVNSPVFHGLLDEVVYLADLHGIEWDSLTRLILGEKMSLRKLYLRYNVLPRRRKRERTLYRKAHALVCAGESIQDKVKELNETLLVRNALNLSQYLPSSCSEAKVAVLGPFVRGTENYLCLDLLEVIVRREQRIPFLLIGKTDEGFKRRLEGYRNVHFMGFVADFPETLRGCSMGLLPFPPSTSYGGAKFKLLSVAACSIPVVATPFGIADFQSEHVLVGRSADELVEHIRALRDEGTRKYYGTKLRQHVEKFHDHVKESKKLLPLYRELEPRG